jgi:HD-GYP domain-containing protein (c-di-GMP phosphodiesterase class II)
MPERWSNLEPVGTRPAAEDSTRSHFRALLTWAPPAAVLVAAALGAVLAQEAAAVAIYVTVAAAAATLLGWRAGESRRGALQLEIEDRSGELHRALTELEIAQSETVRRLSMAVEFRDEDTGAHIERIGRFSTLLAERIGLDRELCERLGYAAPLHDVGKVAIPDAILLKPGPLTAQERAIVETHAEEGHRLLRGSSSSILDMAATIALSHHEKWDGSGYPRGLATEEIPIEGRIVAVADVFDALTSDRVYRTAYSVEQAVQMMRAQRARHFDPALLDAFLEVLSSSGPDARRRDGVDPEALLGGVLDTYFGAIARGDAETAEGAIAQAIEDDIAPAMLHAKVIAPALGRVDELWRAGEIDIETERLAAGITRRILATMFRYMLSGASASRGRVLLAELEGGEELEPAPHALGLQMVHDQLAATGWQTTFETDLSPARLRAAIDHHAPDVLVIGLPTHPIPAGPGSALDSPAASAGPALGRLVEALRESHPQLPILLGGAAEGAAPEELRRAYPGVRALERLDGSAAAVEELLASREPAIG